MNVGNLSMQQHTNCDKQATHSLKLKKGFLLYVSL